MSPSSPAYIPPIEQHFTFERINERYKKDGMALRKAVGENKADVSLTLSRNATRLAQLLHVAEGSKQAEGSHNNGTVIMMDWTKLDTTLSQGNVLRDQVSFLLSEYGIHALTETTRARSSNESGATEQVEVVLLLESPGGSAADYALAAQHILRLRREGIKVTICVDKVAASGKKRRSY
jgi:ClpP class serine protease